MSASLIGRCCQDRIPSVGRVRLRVGHASFRSRLADFAARCTHWSDGMESLAFGRARGHSGHIRLHPDLCPRWGRSRLGSGETAGLCHALASSAPHGNSEPSIHILCRMTASFRATAITARRWPRVFASRMPHALSEYQALLRVTNECAATYKALRTSGSPDLDMRPGLSVSPVWNRRGVIDPAR